ncbi:MAG TPA: hypothetical protein VE871_09540 [Longimicrobium sp.]|nr:hypothetical protein [Longimicrobium sp.]
MRRLLAPLLLLACAAAPAVGAQAPVLRPGSGMQTDYIQPRADTFDLFLGGRTLGTPDGTLMLDTRLATVGGPAAIVRLEMLRIGVGVAQVDSFVLVRATLAPLSSHAEGISVDRSLHFAGGRVRGWTRDGEGRDGKGRDSVDVALPDPVFLSSSMDLVLGALPLRAGYTAKLALYVDGEGVTTARVQVAEPEEVTVPGGQVRAWPVTVRGSGADGTYWMEDGARTLVQFVTADRGMRIVRNRGAGERMAAR